MARIASLSILLSTEGNDFLKEEYGKVIDNVQKKTISAQIKNKNLSGNPSAGTVEAKRFENKTSKAYGTARSGGAGQKTKATPVVVAIDTDRELISEVEQKDVNLYGVDAFVARQAANDGKAMERELERAFFAEAVTAGTALTLTGTTVEEQAEEMIQAVETVQNDFVDGVERDMIQLVCKPKFFGKLRIYMDKVEDGGAAGEEIGYYHGVKVKSSVYLPAGVENAIVMANESIAQPVMITQSPAAKIPLSNAISFGLFYSYGTKAVAPDLIFYDGSF